MKTQGNQVTVSQQNGVTIILLGAQYEQIDETQLEGLAKIVLEVASTANPPRVVLDLACTQFFGSSFIEVLFRAWNRLSARQGGRFAISGLTQYCREIIETTHLDRLWQTYPNVNDAVEAISASE